MNLVSRRACASLIGWAALGAFAAAWTSPAFGAERGPARASAVGNPAGLAASDTEARVIVKFKADSGLMRALVARAALGAGSEADGPQQAQSLSARLGLALRDGRVMGPRAQLVHAAGMRSQDLAARLAAQADVEYAVVDERMRIQAVPNDPLYGAGQATTPAVGQWYLRAPNSNRIVDASSVLSAINIEPAWAITAGKRSVVVAVLDTGVRADHPDLAGKLLAGYDFVSDAGAANDGGGRDADPTDPGDGVTAADVGVVRGCVASDVGSSSWHGTQTAGLIGAATNNAVGMAGVGRDVMVLPVRVLGKCGGDTSDIVDALKWAAGIPVAGVPANLNPAKVINLSLGSSASCSAAYIDVFQQVAAKGVVVVAAAGNDGLAVGSPASCAGVIAVGGVRHAGTKVGYSDLGPEIALSAPAGNCVNLTGSCLFPLLTTANNGAQGPGTNIYTDGDTHPTLGTSFSSPLVAGTVALMFSVNPALTSGQVRAILKGTARPFPADSPGASLRACTAPTGVAQGSECFCTTSACGAGLLDAGAAVTAVGTLWANIAATPTYPLVGREMALSGSLSNAGGIVAGSSFQWEILSGNSIASFVGGTRAPTATLLPSGPGSVVVRMTGIDPTGRLAVSDTTVNVSGAPIARIASIPSSVVVGTAALLDGSASMTSATGSLVLSGYQWLITGGTGHAGFVGAADGPKVTLVADMAGSVTVSLTVTDSAGQQDKTTSLVTAIDGPGSPAASSGGGGAMELGWLLGWLASVVGVYVVTPRPRRILSQRPLAHTR